MDLGNEQWIKIAKIYANLQEVKTDLTMGHTEDYSLISAYSAAKSLNEIKKFRDLTKDLLTEERNKLFYLTDLKNLEDKLQRVLKII